MLCCLLIALAATPVGAWLIGPAPFVCCGPLRAWALPVAQAFAAAFLSAMAVWAIFERVTPSQDLFQPLCRVGTFVAQSFN